MGEGAAGMWWPEISGAGAAGVKPVPTGASAHGVRKILISWFAYACENILNSAGHLSPLPLPAIRKFNTPFFTSVLMIAIMTVCVVTVWLRNRDILRDLFDYSTVITAAGKVEAGFKPYTGVRSPMQSSVYLFNYATERIFGRSYLGLTFGGLVQALGGALLLRWMLRHSLGAVAATLVALAVVLAGPLQHEVFFYNPIGILCLGLVLFGLAAEPRLWPVPSLRLAVVFAALLVGGINKLNYQGATLVLAGLLSLAAWSTGRINRLAAAQNLLLLILAGCILPLAFELAWTGATFAQWFDDVVLLPTARLQLVEQVTDWSIYRHPVYAFHHHILMKGAGGVGLGLLLATGIWLFWDAWANRSRWPDWLVRVALILGGCLMGALLMITSHETVLLTSLAYPILAVALYLQYRRPGQPVDRWVGRVLLAATLCWSVAGGYAAWHGSRLLYGPNPPPLSAYVRVHSRSRALAYLEGIRMLPAEIDAWERTAARLRSLEDEEGKLSGVLLGPTMEWLERAYPEAIVRREPIWYDAGTTLHEGDAAYFKQLLGGGTHRLITHKDWQAWPESITQLLHLGYRLERVGSRDMLYHPRGPALPSVAAEAGDVPNPTAYRNATNSNVLITATRFSAGMAISAAPTGGAFGAKHDTNWSWPLGASDLQGRAVARLDANATEPATVTFRVMADDADNGAILLELPVRLSPQKREVELPLSLQPGGRPLWFETVITSGKPGTVFGGWREMRITHATEAGPSPVLPFRHRLKQAYPAVTVEQPENVWFTRSGDLMQPGDWADVPAENWRRDDARAGLVRIRVELETNPDDPADPVVVTLAWYRAGRFEIMTEKMIDLRVTHSVTLQAKVTEPGGWVGLLARPAGGRGAGHRIRILSWEKP
jgi:hypothetical protein